MAVQYPGVVSPCMDSCGGGRQLGATGPRLGRVRSGRPVDADADADADTDADADAVAEADVDERIIAQ
ncbi:hypothetical protein [Streptomyces sp. NPDC016845]|uniref:hypothetical protein n=1 Tax=Streptomyces sp. NPDC016845 TaxID=3364972 RepID=UPI0037ABAC55